MMDLGWWWGPIALIGVLVAARLVLSVALSGPPRFREGVCTLIVGRKGSGKSLWIMTRVYRHLKAGGTVAANFAVENPFPDRGGKVVEFTGWDELAVMPPFTLVVLDELHLYAPSRQGFRMPEVASWYMSMARHLHHELMAATQHEKRIASSVLLQIDEIVRLQSFPGRWHRARVFDPDHLGAKARPMYVAWFRRQDKVTALYDTYVLVRPDRDADSSGVVRRIMAAHQPEVHDQGDEVA